MFEVDLCLQLPFESRYNNKHLKFEVKDISDLENTLVKFFRENSLQEILDPETGKIRNQYCFLCNGKIYRNIKEIELRRKNEITFFLMLVGG